MKLRPYQQAAVEACYRYLRDKEGNGCIVLPTGAGKSVALAQICHDAVSQWSGRVLVLTHVQELVDQNAEKIRHFLGQSFVGIYSAGLKQKDMHQPVIAASIQSIYKKAFEFEPFDLLIIDESHLIRPDGEGRYVEFITDAKRVNPNLRILGLTATAFRMGTGMICGPQNILNEICYEVGVKELIRDGYLCPLRSKASKCKIDTSSLHLRGGEFLADEVEDLMDTDTRVKAACAEIVQYTQDRHAVLIFASGIAHGKHIVQVLKEEHHIECGFVSGDSPDGWRKKMIADFKSGALKYLCNVNVLTTGFDAPNIDCIVLLRPTMSPGLYYQMVGRSFRLHPSKIDSLILDFGGNILRHGPVDALRISDPKSQGNGDAPAKECPQCNEVIHAAYARCPQCGFEFPPPDKQKHDTTASSEGVLSDEATFTEYVIEAVYYGVHTKKGAEPDAPKSMRVQYKIGFGDYISEWICFEHEGFARKKAETWWKLRSTEPVPATAQEAVTIAEANALLEPTKIIVKRTPSDKYDRIVQYELPQLGPEPEYVPADDQIPF